MKKTITDPLIENSLLLKKDAIKFAKKPVIIPTIKCQYPAKLSIDAAKLCIRHPIFFKIKFGNFLSQPGARKVIKRNLKYLRGTKYCQFPLSSSFYTWKLAYKIEDKAYRARYFFGDNIIPLSLPSCTAKESARYLRKLARSNITTKALETGLETLSDLPKRRLPIRQLQSLHTLKLDEEGDKGIFSPKILGKIDFFVHLKNLSLELRNPYSPEILKDVFGMLGDLAKLTSLTVKLTLNLDENNGQNIPKTFAEKFVKLESLHLQITLPTETTDTGNTFVSFGQFKSIKHLNFELFTDWQMDHHLDAIKFVVSHKHLETLKFQAQDMEHSEYIELFEGIKEMESLTNLCVLQRERTFSTFEYSMVFQTIEALKNLKFFKLSLGYHAFDPDDMRGAFKSLLEHPSLEKVDILMRINPLKKGYDFGDEFCENLKKLYSKLTSFKLYLILFPKIGIEVSLKIKKIILPKGVVSKRFSFRSLYL